MSNLWTPADLGRIDAKIEDGQAAELCRSRTGVGSDYSRIDNGILTVATGWFNGDFNYDGVVNGSDYTLIDNAFNAQGAKLSAMIATPAAKASASNTAVAVPASNVTSLSSSAADSPDWFTRKAPKDSFFE